jgi:predicted NUDIX family phosphoesterase
MKLTKSEISAIADHLDEIIGNNFHDAMYNVIWQRDSDEEVEVSDEDILAIKEQLKRIL